MDHERTSKGNSKSMQKIKEVSKFILFLCYTVSIFFITDYRVMGILTGFQVVLMLTLSIRIRQAVYNLTSISFFIFLTVIINYFVSGLQEAILIAIRLVLICNITYIFSKKVSILEIASAIQTILTPLKLLGIQIENIAIVISIAMAFIPIMIQQLTTIRYALKAKGFRMGFWNLITHMNYILTPLFISLLRKINEIEYALKAKAYVE